MKVYLLKLDLLLYIQKFKMATNQGIGVDLLGGFDVSNTNVYHPSGVKMKKQELDTLECPRCTKFLREPVQLITCGCRFCTVCIDSMLANER